MRIMVVGGIESLGELPDALQEALSQLGIDLDFPEKEPEPTTRVELVVPSGFYPELKANVLRVGGEIVFAEREEVAGEDSVFAGNGGHSVRVPEGYDERLAEFERDESVVWKFPFPNRSGHFTLELPFGSVALTCDLQHGSPCLWAMVPDANAPMETRRFSFQGTGKVVGAGSAPEGYIGTIQMEGGAVVRHLFELETESV